MHYLKTFFQKLYRNIKFSRMALRRGVYSLVPFYTDMHIYLPDDFKHLAITVPVDGKYVIQKEKSRECIPGIKNIFLDEQNFLNNLNLVLENVDLSEVPNTCDPSSTSPCRINNYYSFGDAKILTGIIYKFKSKNLIEIGSGYSTRYARYAIEKYQLNCKITSIDPSPRSKIHDIVDEKITKSVLNADISLFDSLNDGDILFIDGSHLVFHGTDVPYLILNVIPKLKPGVFIHLHDIYLPFEYPKEIDNLFWNEQYMLAAYILNNDSIEVFLPTYYMYKKDMIKDQSVSFWLRKK